MIFFAPGQLRQHDVERADRAGADDQHRVLVPDGQCFLAAEATRERFDQRSLGVTHRFRQREHVATLHREAGHPQVLLEPAVQADPEGLVVGAHVVQADPAEPAVPATHVGRDADPVPLAIPGHLAADEHDVTGDLVPLDPLLPGRDLEMAVPGDPQVRAADGGRAHPDEQFVIGDGRYRDVLHHHPARARGTRRPSRRTHFGKRCNTFHVRRGHRCRHDRGIGSLGQRFRGDREQHLVRPHPAFDEVIEGLGGVRQRQCVADQRGDLQPAGRDAGDHHVPFAPAGRG